MRKGLKLFSVCILCAIALLWRYLLREAQAGHAFTHAQRGEAESTIVARLGAPDQVLPCGKYLWWNGDQFNPPPNNGQCKKRVRYNFFLHAFAFGYSGQGRLVSRYEYSSE